MPDAALIACLLLFTASVLPMLAAATDAPATARSVAAAQREPTAEQFQQMLRRFPDADLNKDGKLTVEEYRQYRRKARPGDTVTAVMPEKIPPAAKSLPAPEPVEIQITSGTPVPVNPRVYGTWCEEMFAKDLVDNPEYVAALVDLKFKTFLYPGGSISYYHHPKGTGGFNIRPVEVAKSKHGESSRFMKEGSGPDHFEQYIRLVKASDGEALFVANILNGTVGELDEFLTRLKAEHVPIAATILGVEMHLGQPGTLGLDGYVTRIKPYLPMLKTKFPEVPVVIHSTPVGRTGERALDSFHQWNQTLTQMPGISGFSQYGWTEFGGQARLQTRRSGLKAESSDDVWQQYDEFVRTFPQRQISAYQKDWGMEKEMYITQWGTHSDRNTAVQGLHVANFYFFMAQYNAAHENYFAAATGALNLAATVGMGMGRSGGIVYKDKVLLLAPYVYSKPFRHLFSGNKKLLATAVKGEKGNGQGQTVKALAATGPDGRKYLYLLNSGPDVGLGRVNLDGEALAEGLMVQIESAFAAPSAAPAEATARRADSAPIKTFTGEKALREVVLEPASLTLLILPSRESGKLNPPTH